MACHFYILHSPSKNKYYLGHTCDSLDSRLEKHNMHHKGYTGQTQDWEVAYSEVYATKEEAFARELDVKGWKSRSRVLRLIQGD